MFFQGCENITINTCRCRPAPSQLIELGLFGCAPVAPTLAVDIEVLQFCRKTFLHLPPNVTGWAHAIEAFLDLKGIEFTAQVRVHFPTILYPAHALFITGRSTQAILARVEVVRGIGELGFPSCTADHRRRPLNLVTNHTDNESATCIRQGWACVGYA